MAFTLTGSLKVAQSKLRQKGLRSYFSLKSMIDLRHILCEIIFKLFDALTVPVVLYGCQIWLPQTYFMGAFSSNNFPNLKQIRKEFTFRFWCGHLTSINKNRMRQSGATQDATLWKSSQVYTYWERLHKMEKAGSNSLVRQPTCLQRAAQPQSFLEHQHRDCTVGSKPNR